MPKQTVKCQICGKKIVNLSKATKCWGPVYKDLPAAEELVKQMKNYKQRYICSPCFLEIKKQEEIKGKLDNLIKKEEE